MTRIYSLTGVNSTTQRNWVWCVPGDDLPANMPFCVLVMSSVGPRYTSEFAWLPSVVIAYCCQVQPKRALAIDRNTHGQRNAGFLISL